MFALVSIAPHVISDRYHPGVATFIVGKKLTLTSYKLESSKMMGLQNMLTYSHSEMVKMNKRSFDALLQVIQRSTHTDENPNPQSLKNCESFGNCAQFDKSALPT